MTTKPYNIQSIIGSDVNEAIKIVINVYKVSAKLMKISVGTKTITVTLLKWKNIHFYKSFV